MGSQRQQKKRARRRVHAQNSPRSKPSRPTPVQAIELQHSAQAERFARRPDRYSQLLAKLIKDERAGQHLVTRSGLSSQEHAELDALRDEAHAAFRQELTDATVSLRELLNSGDPLYIAAHVQATNLMAPWSSYYEPTQAGGENRVELIAGLLASQTPSANDQRPTDTEMQQIYDEIEHILDLLFLFNFSKPRGNDPEAAALQFMGALRWMSIRGTSFADHGEELARALFSPHDPWLLETYGFTVDDVISIGKMIESLTHRSLNTLLDEARHFADRVLSLLNDPGARKQLPAAVKANVATAEDRLMGSMVAFMGVFQSGIRDAATFTIDELCAEAPLIPRERVLAVLTEFSIPVGDVDPSDYTGLFEPSPFVERPILKHAGRYLVPVLGMLVRDTVALLDGRLIRENTSYSKSRAKTLDRLAVECLASMLPGATTYTNLFYDGTELDGFVLFENTAFVVEGKGSAISFQAQRGDVRRLKSEIRDAVQTAWEQGARARDFILTPGDTVFLDEHGNELVRLPTGTVTEVQIVNPTIHELAGHAPQLARFRSHGLFPDELPWSVYINDLRVISETCENAAVFLHYLTWRARLPLGEQVVVHDELDLWGCYLLAARFPPLTDGGMHHVGNSTTDFDTYYDGVQGRGPKRHKPRKFLKEPVKAFIERMASERATGWREAAGVCLDLSVPELGFVCLRALDAARVATRSGALAGFDFGRGLLVGVPRGADTSAVLEHAKQDTADKSFYVYVRQVSAKRAEVVWASYGKEVTFDLSDLEKSVFNAPGASAFQFDTSAAR